MHRTALLLTVALAACGSQRPPDSSASVAITVTNTSDHAQYIKGSAPLQILSADGAAITIAGADECVTLCGSCETSGVCLDDELRLQRSMVRVIAPGESYSTNVAGLVWTNEPNGCGTNIGCSRWHTASSALIASAAYSASYVPSTLPVTVGDLITGTLSAPTSSADASFDFPQVAAVDVQLQ
jgi:hypothetical protein